MNTIIITGAASGIGKATTEHLIEAGWFVGMFDINRAALDDMQRQYGEEHCSVRVVDVTDAGDFGTAIAEFVETRGYLDAIFNCAGIMDMGHFEDIPLEKHARSVDINVKGVLNGTYLAFPYLRQRDRSCAISMSSASSLFGIPSLANYAATKFYVKGLTEGLNTEWRRYGIHVTDIEPPFVKTPLLHGNEAPILDTMGVNLEAEHIAERVLRALTDNRLHHPVSLQYRFLRLLRKFLPEVATQRLIRHLAKY